MFASLHMPHVLQVPKMLQENCKAFLVVGWNVEQTLADMATGDDGEITPTLVLTVFLFFRLFSEWNLLYSWLI